MPKERPLSPHLMVYKPQLTSMLSILHRGCGVFLSLAAPVLVYWLWSISEGQESYSALQACLSHPIAQLFILGWTFALYYHLCNGIRHLFWDIGKGYELPDLYRSGVTVVVVSSLLTVITLYCANMFGGGA